MTGAGGINMANYLSAIAARDGTYIGMMGNTLPSLQAVGGKGVKFDATKFHWLGTIAPVGRDHGGVAHRRREVGRGRCASARSWRARPAAAPPPTSIRP